MSWPAPTLLADCAAQSASSAGAGRSRRNRLVTVVSVIATGIWTMRFAAMLGFGVSDTEIRYDVPLTVLSLLVAMPVSLTNVVRAAVSEVGGLRARGGYDTSRRHRSSLPPSPT